MPTRESASRGDKASKTGPGRGAGGRTTESKKAESKRAAGRAQGKAAGRPSAPKPGRYTPPIPRTVRHSARWYPYVLLTLLIAGIFAIILNYTEVLPASPSGGWVVGGIAAILVAALMATHYR